MTRAESILKNLVYFKNHTQKEIEIDCLKISMPEKCKFFVTLKNGTLQILHPMQKKGDLFQNGFPMFFYDPTIAKNQEMDKRSAILSSSLSLNTFKMLIEEISNPEYQKDFMELFPLYFPLINSGSIDGPQIWKNFNEVLLKQLECFLKTNQGIGPDQISEYFNKAFIEACNKK
jgi:hypothetical protein